jgi:hypothetical protein
MKQWCFLFFILTILSILFEFPFLKLNHYRSETRFDLGVNDMLSCLAFHPTGFLPDRLN